MRNPTKYATYNAFGTKIAGLLGRKKVESETVRRVIWWAEEFGQKDKLDIKYVDGKPVISTSEENISAFVELYKAWKSEERDRKNTFPSKKRRDWPQYGLEYRLFEEDKEIARYIERRR